MTGHLLAAAGAVEVAAVVAAMCGNFLPPTINLDTPDPECDLDYVAGVGRSARVDAALTNSFGFGGQNACLLIRRW
jgi:3-oxoacyl-(acyl-carrier-protein) synthase